MEEKLQFDEGVKEIMLGLLALGSLAYNADHIYDFLNNRPESDKEQLIALDMAANRSPDAKFDDVADELTKNYENKPVLVKVKEPNVKSFKPVEKMAKTKDPSIDQYANYIRPSEIVGNDISLPVNKRYLKPYKDDVGNWTIGIGYLIGDNHSDLKKWVKQHGKAISPQKAEAMFKAKIEKHINRVKKMFPNSWEKFSPELKMVLVDIDFRGDMVNPKGETFQFVKHLRSGKYKEAANEYLDHREFKIRKKKRGMDDGVVKRMIRNSQIIKDQA